VKHIHLHNYYKDMSPSKSQVKGLMK